jgi:hypothetical protein
MIWGFTVSQAVHVAAKLGIADLLRDRPVTAHEVAAASAANEPALLRLLRALTSIDLLVEDEHGRFAATPTGEFLRSDHPQSLRARAIVYGSPFFWRPWGNLAGSIATGKPAFDLVYGEPFFAHLAHTSEDADAFNAFATSATGGDLLAILAAYDFSGLAKIVDVGGGQGALLQGILERYPKATGVLFDLPAVVAGAHDLRESTVAARCDIVAGDMFQAVPPGGDAYLLTAILHDWADAEAIQILRTCRRAIAGAGKLIVIDAVLAPSNVPDFAKLLDLMMLVLLTGRERTEVEFRNLYAAAGFRLSRIIPAGEAAIIEGVPV